MRVHRFKVRKWTAGQAMMRNHLHTGRFFILGPEGRVLIDDLPNRAVAMRLKEKLTANQ